MGNLKPGASYIYENSDGVIYAREINAPHNERFEIGRTLDRQQDDQVKLEIELWKDLKFAAENDPLLQEALDRVIILYHLRKKDGKK